MTANRLTPAERRAQRDECLRILLHFSPQPTSLPITIDYGVIADLFRDRRIIRFGIDPQTRRAAYKLRSETGALSELVGVPDLFADHLGD